MQDYGDGLTAQRGLARWFGDYNTGASAPSAGLCHARGVVPCARIVWSQARGLAMEIVDRGAPGVQPSVRPFDPDGSQGLTPGWTPEPRSGVIVETQSSEEQTKLIQQSLRT